MDELSQLLGESPAINLLREKLRQLLERQPAGRRLPAMLIQGETGTGKGLVARIVHRMGPRKGGPFVDINCPAIPETLLEAELFGFERGAFTDAHRAKPGLFQAAHGGTLFLDEVGLLPGSVQAKLLTAIEEKSVRRLGSTRPEPVDACFISATNIDLRAALREQRFREDLYHRLAVITLALPALRDRGDDVLLLAEQFLARICADYGLAPKRLDEKAQARLLAYAWPGNIRELNNVIERAALFAESPVITGAMLDPLQVEGSSLAASVTGGMAGVVPPEEANRQYLVAALEESEWNISRAAARLGVTRNTVYARLAKYGVRGHRAGQPPPRRDSRTATVAALAATGTHVHWERCRVTLLSASLSAPDGIDAWSVASRALDVVIDKLQTFGGRIEELTPTGVVASFGVEPVDDAPRRAAHAALVIHKGAARTGESTSRAPGVKIGLHVAQLLVGRSETRVDIDADAKRGLWALLDQLLETVGTDQTVASAAAASFLERRFELVPNDDDAGRANRSYRLTGQEHRGLGLWGSMTQFVGRREEFEVLRSRLAAAGSGHGQIVAIVGEPGVGKSRLIWEFTHSSHVDGWLVLQADAVPYGKTTPYLPVIDLLKAYCGIGDRDDWHAIREKVTGKLLALDPVFEAILPAFLTLLDLPVEDREWQGLDPAGRRLRTLDAIKRLLLCQSHAQPLAVVFEDLHWLDGETQVVLDSLAESLPGVRLLILISYRAEHAHGWGSKTFYTQLRIDPLPPESAEVLLKVLLGKDPGLDPLKRLLIQRTEGNPLFVEESVRELVETGALTGERGDYRPARELPEIHVPGTVQAILTARIDRLIPEDRWLLQTGAVIGKNFPFALLLAVADGKEEALHRSLGHLQTAEFVYETNLSPDLEYTFKHALTHEVAYASLLPDRRRDLHARIVEAMERLYGNRLAEQVDRLAYHALRAEQWEKAVVLYRQAAAKAVARSAGREAADSFDQALTALAHCPDTRATRELSVDVRCDLQGPLVGLGELARMLDNLRQAEGLASALDDQPRLGKVSAHMTTCFWWMGDYERAVEAGRRAEAIALSIGDFELQVLTNYRLGQAHFYRGEFAPAVEVFQRNVEALWGDLRRKVLPALPALPAVSARAFIGMHRMYQGDFARALDLMKEAVNIAESADHHYSLYYACYSLGSVHVSQGRPDLALPWLERSLELYRAREGNFAFLFPLLSSWLGHAWAVTGRIPEAVALVEQGARQVASMRMGNFGAQMANALADVYLFAGRLDDALTSARAALQQSRTQREPAAEGTALWLLGEILSRSRLPESEHADESYRAALMLAERFAFRPLMAKCHLGLARLDRRDGKPQNAVEHLTTAMEMFRELDMTFWLQQAEADMRA
jgi:transcriptional regulator with AAA-type ATPase domain/tetratricopeptide (TPR) repeat protein